MLHLHQRQISLVGGSASRFQAWRDACRTALVLQASAALQPILMARTSSSGIDGSRVPKRRSVPM